MQHPKAEASPSRSARRVAWVCVGAVTVGLNVAQRSQAIHLRLPQGRGHAAVFFDELGLPLVLAGLFEPAPLLSTTNMELVVLPTSLLAALLIMPLTLPNGLLLCVFGRSAEQTLCPVTLQE